ncbi:translation initiation factor IF-2-like [Schistocerca cancellata]|uniref:translation initiation factor IF-2-like n=1 Tax=Schistocerca cancellata TaxID=274614 RepID=UPI002117E452|nr:translation initiation factor IF-2-like [Schistocerca cancellata]
MFCVRFCTGALVGSRLSPFSRRRRSNQPSPLVRQIVFWQLRRQFGKLRPRPLYYNQPSQGPRRGHALPPAARITLPLTPLRGRHHCLLPVVGTFPRSSRTAVQQQGHGVPRVEVTQPRSVRLRGELAGLERGWSPAKAGLLRSARRAPRCFRLSGGLSAPRCAALSARLMRPSAGPRLFFGDRPEARSTRHAAASVLDAAATPPSPATPLPRLKRHRFSPESARRPALRASRVDGSRPVTLRRGGGTPDTATSTNEAAGAPRLHSSLPPSSHNGQRGASVRASGARKRLVASRLQLRRHLRPASAPAASPLPPPLANNDGHCIPESLKFRARRAVRGRQGAASQTTSRHAQALAVPTRLLPEPRQSGHPFRTGGGGRAAPSEPAVNSAPAAPCEECNCRPAPSRHRGRCGGAASSRPEPAEATALTPRLWRAPICKCN